MRRQTPLNRLLCRAGGDRVAKIKGKHPSWFKLKVERRELIKTLEPTVAVNVLLACLDYLVDRKPPSTLTDWEKAIFSLLLPDVEEAWCTYSARVENGGMGGAPKGNKNAKKEKQPYGSIWGHMGAKGTEEEVEEKPLRVFPSKTGGDLKNGDAAFKGGPPTPFPIDPDTGEYIDREGNA